jgi:hypothetical protein
MKNQINFIVLFYICIPLPLLSSCSNKNPDLPKLETETVTAITQTTAISGGKIISDGGAEITAKGVCWGTSMNPTLSDPHTSEGTGDDVFASTLIELTPKTDYHVRAFSTNIEGIAYGDDKTFRTLSSAPAGQIIADHTVVAKYDDIPQYYIDLVKKMWVSYAGESHSGATRAGLLALETAYPTFAVSVAESGIPEAYTTSNLRFSRATWGDYANATGWMYSYGEEDWFTSAAAISRTKAGITYCNTHNPELAAIGFGWCYDYDTDFADYIIATQEYVDYCTSNGYSTKVFFTTAPVDDFLSSGQAGYIRYIENESIRSHVDANATRILFDYADILCYDNNGSGNTSTWDGHTYPVATATNISPTVESYHISEAGALRLAKAMWWMLARIAGWDGN